MTAVAPRPSAPRRPRAEPLDYQGLIMLGLWIGTGCWFGLVAVVIAITTIW